MASGTGSRPVDQLGGAPARHLVELERENARLTAKLGTAEWIIDAHTCPGGQTLAPEVGVQTACEALAVPRSSLYAAPPPAPPRRAASPPNALSPTEKAAVLAQLNSKRFADQIPYEIYPHRLDEGQYHR